MSVTTGNNEGPGSLRYAILNSKAGNQILIHHTLKDPIVLTSPIMIPHDVKVISLTGNVITVSDTWSDYPYMIICAAGSSVTFQGITFTGNANSPSTLAILSEGNAHSNRTALTLIFCAVTEWIGTGTKDIGPITVRQANMYLQQTEIRNNTGYVAGVCQILPIESGVFDSIISKCLFANNVGTYVSSCLIKGIAKVNYILSDTVIINNLACVGTSGIKYELTNAVGTIVKCRFEDNDVDTGVSALECCGQVTMSQCVFRSNRVSNGHTVVFSDNVNVTTTSFENSSCFSQSNLVITESVISNGYGLTSEGTLQMTNCSVFENTVGLALVSGTIRSTTIVKNGIGIEALNSGNDIVIYNTIVGLNGVDINGNVTGSHNLVSVKTSDMSMVDSLIGTKANPIDPNVGRPGDYGGNGIKVVPLLLGSPAINAGSNEWVTTEYDQRGAPHLRIQTKTDIGAFEATFVPVTCYLGSSKVKVRNKINGYVSVIPVSKVYADLYEVYDVITGNFIPIVYNAVIRGATRIYKIKSGWLGKDQPTDDLFISSGHPISAYGQVIKVRDIEDAVRVKISPSDVYSIVTQGWQPIEINGIGVYSWSEKEWNAYIRKVGVGWIDNTKEYVKSKSKPKTKKQHRLACLRLQRKRIS